MLQPLARSLPQRLARAWQLTTRTVDEFSKSGGDLLAAALAFHTLLSIAPFIIVAVAIASTVLGQGAASEEVTRLLLDTIGPRGAQAINEWVAEASRAGKVASVVGIGLALLAASRLGTNLHAALNQIWKVNVQDAEGFKSTIKAYVRRRMFAFAFVAAAGPLLLVVFASRTLLTGFHAILFDESPLQGVIIQVLQIALSITIVALISGVVFRYVPDVRVGWRNVLIGGVLTSLLFNLGNVLIGLYLGRAGVTATYGAAGSLVAVLLWLYFSAQIFLLGAAFTRVYTQQHGPGLSPKERREVEEEMHRPRAKLSTPG